MPEEYFLTLVGPRVAPAARPWESGLPIEDGHTLPFVVDRGWVGPAGTYIEEWSIRTGETVLYRHPAKYIEVRGFQSVRRFSDTVRHPIRLEPGIYDITFVVEQYRMGSFAVEVRPMSEDAEVPHAVVAAVTPEAMAAVAAVAPPAPAPAAPPAAAAAAPVAPAPKAATAPAVPYTGEDPAAVRKRVYEEELAKGSDPRVAEARAKSAEIKAKRAMAAAAAAPAAPVEAPAAPTPAPVPPAPAAPAEAPSGPAAPVEAPAPAAPEGAPPVVVDSAATPAASPLLPDAPPGGGGMSPPDAAVARGIVYRQAIESGSSAPVAEAQATAAEIRAERGVWWRPDW